MSTTTGALVVVGVLAAATLVGLLLRQRDGRWRVRAERPVVLDAATLAVTGLGAPGPRATIVQVSTPWCQPCRVAQRVLEPFADHEVHVLHLDAQDHPDLARRLDVLRTPTVLLLHPDGRELARTVGVPDAGDLRTTLDALVPRPQESTR